MPCRAHRAGWTRCGHRRHGGRRPLGHSRPPLPAHSTRRLTDQSVAGAITSESAPETVDEAEAKGTRLLALEGASCAAGFQSIPALRCGHQLSSTADSRLRRQLAAHQCPRQQAPMGPGARRADRRRSAQLRPVPHPRCPAHRPSKQQHLSGPHPAVHTKARRLGARAPGSRRLGAANQGAARPLHRGSGVASASPFHVKRQRPEELGLRRPFSVAE
jgi:hypothetical protein